MFKTVLRHYIIDYAIKSVYDSFIKNFSVLPCITHETINDSHIGVKCKSVHSSYGVFYLNNPVYSTNEYLGNFSPEIVHDLMIISHDMAIPELSSYATRIFGDDSDCNYFVLITIGSILADNTLFGWKIVVPFNSTTIAYI